MNNNSPFSQDIAYKKRSSLIKWSLFGFTVLLLIMMAFMMLLDRFEAKEYQMAKTPYTSSNFAHLAGDSLYTYNGLAFLKTNIKNGTIETLSSGDWFPTPTDVKWVGSKGVLMKFSIFFPLTMAESKVQNLQERFPNRDADQYTWFYDFGNHSLKLVNEQPLLTDNAAHYSESENGIYYLSSNRFLSGDTDVINNSLSLYFYNLSTKKSTTVSNNLDITSTDTLHGCPDSQGVCFIGRDTKDILKAKLFQVKSGSNGSAAVLLESTGRIFRTNNPDRYATIEFSRDKDHSEEDHGVAEGEVELTNEPVTLHSISQKKTYKLDFKAGISEPNIHFVDDTQFYVLFNNSEVVDDRVTYRSGMLTDSASKSKEFDLTYRTDSEPVSQLVTINNISTGDSVLVSTVDKELAIFNASQLTEFNSVDISKAMEVIEGCATPLGVKTELVSNEKMLRIVVNQGSSFNKSISEVSKCIVKSDMKVFQGYTFQFAAINPFSSSVTFY